jgi:N-dimethylarginine dimethylaminohydrolase
MSTILLSHKFNQLEYEKTTIDRGYSIIKHFRRETIKAVLESLGVKIEYITNVESPIISRSSMFEKVTRRDCVFIRDPIFTFHDKELIIICDKMINDSQYILPSLPHNYKKLFLKNSYFEGGNMLYSPKSKMLFHGSTPGGFYKQSAHPNQYDTNNELNKVLKEYDISVYGLELHSKIRYNSSGISPANNEYYHLDCFMTCLPDNKILILNMDILCPESQAFLREHFEIIDMKYENYIHEAFIPNPLCIGTPENYTVLFSYRLPEKCKVLLNIHQIKFITPSTLESREKDFDAVFAEKVAKNLQEKGFESANALNIGLSVPKNMNGYVFQDGKGKGHPNYYDGALGAYGLPLNEYYSQNDGYCKSKGVINQSTCFQVGRSGGLHCATLEKK